MLVDLTSIQPGDVLLTRGESVKSGLLAVGQRVLHLAMGGRNFTHAAIFVTPFIRFETVPGKGARFSRNHAAHITYEGGKLRLWWAPEHVQDAVVMRYPPPEAGATRPETLLDAAVEFNTERYPNLSGFLPLLSQLHRFSQSVGLGDAFEYKPQREKFCSALVLELHHRLGSARGTKSPGQVSPMRLHEPQLAVTGIVKKRSEIQPLEDSNALHYLFMAQSVAGDQRLDAFMQGMENLQASFNRTMTAMGRNASDKLRKVVEESASLMTDPRKTQYSLLLDAIVSGQQLIDDLRGCEACFSDCKTCSHPTACLTTTAKRFERSGARKNAAAWTPLESL